MIIKDEKTLIMINKSSPYYKSFRNLQFSLIFLEDSEIRITYLLSRIKYQLQTKS